MSAARQVFVDCIRGGVIIATYEFGYGDTLAGPARPTYETLIAEAKSNLANLGAALPPFDGIEFRVRW